MINGIVAAALGGACGGAIGGLLGAGWEKLRKQPAGQRSFVAASLAIVFALGGARVAANLNEPSLEQQLDQNNPALAAMHRYYPADYAQMVAALRAQQAGLDAAAIHAKMLPYLSNLVSRHTREIDEAGARETFSLLVAETQVLKDKSPESCVALTAGKPLTVDLSAVLPAELGKRDLANTAAILQQIATHPAEAAPPLSDSDAAKFALRALGALDPAEQAVVKSLYQSGKPPQTDQEMRAMCNFNIKFFGEALAAPSGTLRRLLASG